MNQLNNFNALPGADQIKILNAVDSLAINNPDLANQLTKLADIKLNQPLVWRVALLKLGL